VWWQSALELSKAHLSDGSENFKQRYVRRISSTHDIAAMVSWQKSFHWASKAKIGKMFHLAYCFG
jgi:hypothetical protein